MSAACVTGPSLKNENRQPPAAPESKLTELDRDIESMKTADFEFIFVFRRKDGGKLEVQDKRYLRENSPPETNRFLISDDDKAVIAGSFYEFDAKYLKALGARFTIEDHSRRKGGDENNAAQR